MRYGSESVYMTGDAIILSVFEKMAGHYENKEILFDYLDNRVNLLYTVLEPSTGYQRQPRSIEEIFEGGKWSEEKGSRHVPIFFNGAYFEHIAVGCTEESNKLLVKHIIAEEKKRYEAMMTMFENTEEKIDFYKSECIKYLGMNEIFYRKCKLKDEEKTDDEIDIDEKLKELSEYLETVEGAEQDTMQNSMQE